MGSTLNNRSTTTEPSPQNGQQPKPPGYVKYHATLGRYIHMYTYTTGFQPSNWSVVSTLIPHPYPCPNQSDIPSLYDDVIIFFIIIVFFHYVLTKLYVFFFVFFLFFFCSCTRFVFK